MQIALMILFGLLAIQLLLWNVLVWRIYGYQKQTNNILNNVVEVNTLVKQGKKAVDDIAKKIAEEDPEFIASLIEESVPEGKKKKIKISEFAQ